MTLLQRGQTAGAVDSGRVLANLNAADYLGALVGGLAWPFVCCRNWHDSRRCGHRDDQSAAAAVVALFLLRRVVSGRELATALAALAAAFALLTALIVGAGGIEATSRQQLYADRSSPTSTRPTRRSSSTRRRRDMRLYLDGGLQFSHATNTATPRAWSTGAGRRRAVGPGDRRRGRSCRP